MWDPKPDAPAEVRGPFGSIPSCVPGIRVSEHLPLQARIMDKLTLIRSVDCRDANDADLFMLQPGAEICITTISEPQKSCKFSVQWKPRPCFEHSTVIGNDRRNLRVWNTTNLDSRC